MGYTIKSIGMILQAGFLSMFADRGLKHVVLQSLKTTSSPSSNKTDNPIIFPNIYRLTYGSRLITFNDSCHLNGNLISQFLFFHLVWNAKQTRNPRGAQEVGQLACWLNLRSGFMLPNAAEKPWKTTAGEKQNNVWTDLLIQSKEALTYNYVANNSK